MHYAVVYFPEVYPESVNRIRREYDPTEPIVRPHIGVVFPVPESVGEDKLAGHVERVLGAWGRFPVGIGGLKKSFDHWLLLTLEEGYDDVVRLYREMNTGILATYRRDDIEFIPHISLGLFVKGSTPYDGGQRSQFDERRYRGALEEVQKEDLNFKCVVDRLHLCEVPTDVMEWMGGKKASFAEGSRVVVGREFKL
jgi:hypothetical protein